MFSCCGREKIISFSFDFLSVLISLSDIVTDLMITSYYYQTGKMNFFYVAVGILVLTQIAYTALFIFNYFPSPTPKEVVYASFSVFFVAQFVPLMIWLDSLDLDCIQGLHKRFGLKPPGRGKLNNLSFTQLLEDEEFDKFIFEWIKIKAMAHFGFLVESVLEAFPQSILQMVCIIWYQEAEPIAIFSMLISLFTVASKGVVISFSMNPSVFKFNLLSVVLDIFGFFTTLAWVCLQGNEDSIETRWFHWQLNWMAKVVFSGICIAAWIVFGMSVVRAVRQDIKDVYNIHGFNCYQILLYYKSGVSNFWNSVKTQWTYWRNKSVLQKVSLVLMWALILCCMCAVPFLVIMIFQIFNLMLLSLYFIGEEFKWYSTKNFSNTLNYVVDGETNSESELRYLASKCGSFSNQNLEMSELIATQTPSAQFRVAFERVTNLLKTLFCGIRSTGEESTRKKNLGRRQKFIKSMDRLSECGKDLEIEQLECPKCNWEIVREKIGSFLGWLWNELYVSEDTWFQRLTSLGQIIGLAYLFVVVPSAIILTTLVNTALPMIALVNAFFSNLENTSDLQYVMSSIYVFLVICWLYFLAFTLKYRYWQFWITNLSNYRPLWKTMIDRRKFQYSNELKSIVFEECHETIAGIIHSFVPTTLESIDDEMIRARIQQEDAESEFLRRANKKHS